jgi:hypothetical protein
VIFLWSLNVLAEAQPAAVIEECRRDNCVTQECSRYQCLSSGIEEGTPLLIHRLAELSHRSHPPFLLQRLLARSVPIPQRIRNELEITELQFRGRQGEVFMMKTACRDSDERRNSNFESEN